ncbi:lipopolysaccharide biosynthesis protein [Sphingobium estronivorans]|uniref:lipopolysaccharide biosynthesis protein n=1 Tax=Sphingobium estronivorans TaxID=1577690 RepID=UPI0012387C55|nr:lipopolysaccharide biosynthesis protein [Sphingobium estronivorans]
MTDRSGITGRIFRGLGLVLGGKAGAGLISLAYLILAARALGPRDYGILVLVHGYVTAVVGIVEFPAWQAIVRYGAEACAEDAPHRLARLLRFGTTVELLGGAAAIVAAMALAPFVGPHLGWPPETVAFAIPYSFAVLGSVRSAPAGYLQLIDRFDLIGLHNMVQPLVRLIGATLAWWLGWGLKGFLCAWLAAALAEFAVLWGMGLICALNRLGPALRRPEAGSAVQDNPGIWRFLVASNADVTLSELAGRIAPLIVGWILGPAMAGLFAVAQRATVIIAQPAQILGNTAYAELARMVAAGQGGAPLRRTLIRVIGIALAAAAPVVIIAALFPTPIVTLLAGPAFKAAGGVTVVLIAARMIAVVGPPCSAALSAMGFPALSMSANLFASLIFLPALPFLLHQWGLMGAGAQAVGQALLASTLLAGLVWRRSLVH